jgi:restriction system protein
MSQSSALKAMWEKHIVHDGLSTYRVVRGQTQEEVETKARLQLALWDVRWRRKQELERSRAKRASHELQRELRLKSDSEAKEVAIERTRELESQSEELSNLLSAVYGKDTRVNWEELKDRGPFPEDRPKPPNLESIPSSPDPDKYSPQAVDYMPNLWEIVVYPVRKRRLAAVDAENRRRAEDAKKRFETDLHLWEALKSDIEKRHKANLERYKSELESWNARKQEFERQQASANAAIDQLKSDYEAGEISSISRYCDEVLNQSQYPDTFPKEHYTQFESASATLIVDYGLPNRNALPSLKEVKYIAARSEFKETPQSEAWINKTYDSVLYQIALRTIYELFHADETRKINTLVFNGWVRSIDRATGAEIHPCIMSLQATREEFGTINLAQVDPKACFRRLKGVAASRLADMSPVRPLLILNREDKRFVDGYSVVDSIDNRTNLAAMDWLDFENLIRELFEKEFSQSGGEVKITQASRDKGVDAIAFDPDVIRGGKIVIQAKRYTNTVGVEAVRDLFGTVHNEGAIKGILVTTSHFGPDAYDFAKGKPLTLLSGGELLYLLEKHGHPAKIDLEEAKRLAAEQA